MSYSPFVPLLILILLMEKENLWFLFECCAIVFFWLPFLFQINHVKLKQKQTHKYRGQLAVKKIKVVTTSRQQKRYRGQISSNPENLIKLKLVSEPVHTFESPVSTHIRLFNARSVCTDEK